MRDWINFQTILLEPCSYSRGAPTATQDPVGHEMTTILILVLGVGPQPPLFSNEWPAAP